MIIHTRPSKKVKVKNKPGYKLAKQGITKLIQVVGVMSTPIMLLGVYAGTGVFAATYTSVTYWFIVAILGMANYEQSHS